MLNRGHPWQNCDVLARRHWTTGGAGDEATAGDECRALPPGHVNADQLIALPSTVANSHCMTAMVVADTHQFGGDLANRRVPGDLPEAAVFMPPQAHRSRFMAFWK